MVQRVGYGQVFWKTLNFQGAVFAAAGIVTFALLFGAFRILTPPGFGERRAGNILINGRPFSLPIGPVLSFVAAIGSALIAFVAAAAWSSDWTTIALWWYGPANASSVVDPIFGRPLDFYLFTFPVWQLAAGWFMTLAVLTFGMGLFFFITSGGATSFRQRGPADASVRRRLLLSAAPLIVAIAVEVYLGRFERLFTDHAIFAGITYTDAHVTVTGMLLAAMALVRRRHRRRRRGVRRPSRSLARGRTTPGGGAVSGDRRHRRVCRELHREAQRTRARAAYITHNIEFTRQAYGLNRIAQRAFPAETTVEAADAANNQATLQKSASGTGACSRTRCGSSRRSAPTTTFPISTSIATSSTGTRGRSCSPRAS